MLQVGNTQYSMFNMMVSACPFYFVLLETHYTGEMNFPPINGVDEGSLFYVLISFYTGIHGSVNVWANTTKEVFG